MENSKLLEQAGLQITQVIKIIFHFFIQKIILQKVLIILFLKVMSMINYNKTESSETNSNAMLIGGSMEDLIYQHSPVIPLYYDMSIRILNKRINGMNNNPINMLDLRKVKK